MNDSNMFETFLDSYKTKFIECYWGKGIEREEYDTMIRVIYETAQKYKEHPIVIQANNEHPEYDNTKKTFKKMNRIESYVHYIMKRYFG